MGKSAARTKNLSYDNLKSLHSFVGDKVRELRGEMLPSDFASKNGVHQAWVSQCEAGQPTCRSRLQFLASKNDLTVGYFFPDGKVPAHYPEY